MRIWTLDNDPEGQAQFAELVADGATRKQIAEVFSIDTDTVTEWKKRPEIQERVNKLRRERSQRVLTHVDKKIMGRLESEEVDIPTETLLRIRQTYAGEVPLDNKGDADSAAAALLKAAHDDPQLAALLKGLSRDAESA